MKKILAFAITALLVVGSTAALAAHDDRKQVKNLDVSFQSGIGVKLLVTNRNDYPVYDVSLNMDVLDVHGGHTIISTVPRAIIIDELAAGESGTLNIMSFGLPGPVSVTATISYENNGHTCTQTVTGTLFMFGFFTFVIHR